MRHLVWSFLERFFPRAATALISLVLASILTPGDLGVYSWLIIGLTLFQSVTDASVRQVAVTSVAGKAGLAFLRKYAISTSFGGAAFLFLVILALVTTLPSKLSGQAWLLLPVLAIPALTAARAKYVAYLQTLARWRLLAGAQFASALISFTVSIPLLITTRSLLATAIQLALTEAWFTFSVVRAAKKNGWDGYLLALPEGVSPFRDFRHVAGYSTLGWLQGQGDRLLIGLLAGPAALGSWAFAWSVSRSVGDAVSNSTANVLRPNVVQTPRLPGEVIARRADEVLVKAIFLCMLIVVGTVAANKLILPLFLSAEWGRSLELVPVMVLSIIPTLLSWNLTVTLMGLGELRWATPIKFVGVALSVVVALVALRDLYLAAWVLVGREVLGLALMSLASRAAAPRRSLVFGGVAIALLAVLVVLLR